MADLLEEVRQTGTVWDGMKAYNAQLREKIEALEVKNKQAEKEKAEAIALLDQFEAEGAAALAKNTDGTITPSGN